jgi:hypothetical protein
VIPIAGTRDQIAATLERLRSGLVRGPTTMFDELEARRQQLYDHVPVNASLQDVQTRVWSDFAATTTSR